MDENGNMVFFLLKQLTIQTFYLMSPHLQCNNISQLNFKTRNLFFAFYDFVHESTVSATSKIVVRKSKDNKQNKKQTKNKKQKQKQKNNPLPPKKIIIKKN